MSSLPESELKSKINIVLGDLKRKRNECENEISVIRQKEAKEEEQTKILINKDTADYQRQIEELKQKIQEIENKYDDDKSKCLKIELKKKDQCENDLNEYDKQLRKLRILDQIFNESIRWVVVLDSSDEDSDEDSDENNENSSEDSKDSSEDSEENNKGHEKIDNKDCNEVDGKDCNEVDGKDCNEVDGKDCNEVDGKDCNEVDGKDCNEVDGKDCGKFDVGDFNKVGGKSCSSIEISAPNEKYGTEKLLDEEKLLNEEKLLESKFGDGGDKEKNNKSCYETKNKKYHESNAVKITLLRIPGRLIANARSKHSICKDDRGWDGKYIHDYDEWRIDKNYLTVSFANYALDSGNIFSDELNCHDLLKVEVLNPRSKACDDQKITVNRENQPILFEDIDAIGFDDLFYSENVKEIDYDGDHHGIRAIGEVICNRPIFLYCLP